MTFICPQTMVRPHVYPHNLTHHNSRQVLVLLISRGSMYRQLGINSVAYQQFTLNYCADYVYIYIRSVGLERANKSESINRWNWGVTPNSCEPYLPYVKSNEQENIISQQLVCLDMPLNNPVVTMAPPVMIMIKLSRLQSPNNSDFNYSSLQTTDRLQSQHWGLGSSLQTVL